jgi:hypothetical protein
MPETTINPVPPPPARRKLSLSARAQRELRERLGVSHPPGMQEPLRQRVKRKLRTFLWVAPLTVLIWVYAEREQVTELNDVRVPIEVRSDSPDRIATIVSDERTVAVDLSGPRANLDAVRDRLADGRTRIEIVVSEPAGFNSDISIGDRIGKSDVFVRGGVAVGRTKPQSIRVRVEARVSKALPVRVRRTDPIVGNISFEPDTITVSGPQSAFEALLPEQLVVYAEMGKFIGRPPGKYDEIVAVSIPLRGEHIGLDRPTVRAKVEITEAKTDLLPSIPVSVLLPALTLDRDKYKVQCQELTLKNVKVTGPTEVVAALKEGKLPASVVIELTADQLAAPGEKTVQLKPTDYRMPKDVTVLEPERAVTVVVTERGG